MRSMNSTRSRIFATSLLAGAVSLRSVTAFAASEEDETRARRLLAAGTQALEGNDAKRAIEQCTASLKLVASPPGYVCVGRALVASERFASAPDAFEAAKRITVTENDPGSWKRAQREALAEAPKAPPLYELVQDHADEYWLALRALQGKDLAAVNRSVAAFADDSLALYICAVVSAELEDDGAALPLLGRLHGASMSPALAKAANELRAKIENRTTIIGLAPEFPSGSFATFDGRDIGLTASGKKVVRIGKHDVVVRAPGMAPQVTQATLAAGKVFEIPNNLKPLKPWKLVAYSSYGAAALLAGGAFYFGLQASSIDAELAKVCEGSQCPPVAAGRMSDLSNSAAMAMGLGIGAAVVAATGVTFQILAAGETDQVDETRRSLELRGSAKGIDLLLRF